MLNYELGTWIGDKEVKVQCGLPTARVLLALWADAEPDHTYCRNLVNGDCIVCFLDAEEDQPNEYEGH